MQAVTNLFSLFVSGPTTNHSSAPPSEPTNNGRAKPDTSKQQPPPSQQRRNSPPAPSKKASPPPPAHRSPPPPAQRKPHRQPSPVKKVDSPPAKKHEQFKPAEDNVAKPEDFLPVSHHQAVFKFSLVNFANWSFRVDFMRSFFLYCDIIVCWSNGFEVCLLVRNILFCLFVKGNLSSYGIL